MWGASNDKDPNPQNATMQKGEGRIPRTPRFEAYVPRMLSTARGNQNGSLVESEEYKT